MRRFVFFAILSIVSFSVVGVRGQFAIRSAKNVHSFIVCGGGGGDSWNKGTQTWSDSLGDLARRFVTAKEDTMLGIDMENRNVFDYIGYGDPASDTVLYSGPMAQYLDYLGACPVSIADMLDNAATLRIELERHRAWGNPFTQYDGFMMHDSTGGNRALVGRNAFDAAASAPKFAQQLSPQYCVDANNAINPSSRWSDTSINCIQLKRGRDFPGVFDDTIADKYLFNRDSSMFWHWSNDWGNVLKWDFRFRVRVDTTSLGALTLGDSLFTVLVRQDTSNVWDTQLDTVVRIDTNLRYVGTGFDTIDLVFYSLPGGGNQTSISLAWQGHASLTFDYLDVLTAELDTTDIDRTISNYSGYPPSHEIWQLGAQRLLKHNADTLKAVLTQLYNDVGGAGNLHTNFVETGEEYSLACERVIKRARKLLYDITGGGLEFFTIVHDSADRGPYNIDTDAPDSTGCSVSPDTAGFYRFGLPNMFDYQTSAVHLGWEDPNLYRDPKIFVVEPYPIGSQTPMPRRLLDTNFAAVYTWDTLNEPMIFGMTYYHTCPDNVWRYSDTNCTAHVEPYSIAHYLERSQQSYAIFLRSLRLAENACIRNVDSGQHFWLAWQCGTRPGYVSATTLGGNAFYGWANGLREPTGPELKIQANLAVSCGATGLFMYTMRDFPFVNDSGKYDAGLGNGGLIDWNGNRYVNRYTYAIYSTADSATTSLVPVQTMWSGWKERFDTAKSFIPIIKIYGDTLLNAHFLGDCMATEPAPLGAPFVSESIRALNDSSVLDKYVPLASDSAFPIKRANKTFVHVSTWVDTTGGQSDTLLYITNMRTDDSYVWNAAHTDSIPSTMDRRFISMQMKAPHYVTDILDTNATRYLDNGRIWTPYVGIGDNLIVQLLPGDGILLRLSAPPPDTNQQLQMAIDYPQNSGSSTQDYNNYGRVNMDHAVSGSKLVNGHQSVPSTWHTYVGVANSDSLKLNQDSALYQAVPSRNGNWRQQNWARIGATSSPINFIFRDTLQPASSKRVRQYSYDSLAHPVTITTDLEERGTGGKVKIFDPWYVDTTLRNFNTSSDTLGVNAPFMPGYGSLSEFDENHYGGIFLHQNEYPRFPTTPMYALSSYETLRWATLLPTDLAPGWIDWVQILWYKNEGVSLLDPEPWTSEGTIFQRAMAVVFRKDSATYTAFYHTHMGTFSSTATPDTGFDGNGQRKFFYLYTDPATGYPWYRVVYSSAGRIYTAKGYRRDTVGDMNFEPEQLVSDFLDTTACYPAEMEHSCVIPNDFDYIYEADGDLIFAHLDSTSPVASRHAMAEFDPDDTPLTPIMGAISGADFWNGVGFYAVSVIAWPCKDGIHVIAIDNYDSLFSNVVVIHPPNFSGMPGWPQTDPCTRRPSIWCDTTIAHDFTINHNPLLNFWVSYNADTLGKAGYKKDSADISGLHDTMACVYCAQLQLTFGNLHPPTISLISSPANISKLADSAMLDARNSCISGCRIENLGHDTEMVKVAFQASQLPTHAVQGISVVQWRTARSWTADFFFQTDDPVNDSFTLPSIEVSRWHGDSIVGVGHDNYYTLAHERYNGTAVQHWAYDSATSRFFPADWYWYHPVYHPNLSVIPSSHDSLIREMSLSYQSWEPRWIVYNSGGMFGAMKSLVEQDTVWDYRAISEDDSSGNVRVTHGMGELNIDNGLITGYTDLAARDPSFSVDSDHTDAFMMQSEQFTLPTSGSLSYYVFIRASSDSMFRQHLDSAKFALDFYDTTGNFLMRLDSITIRDSAEYASTRTVLLSGSGPTGFVSFHRVGGAFTTGGSTWQEIIRTTSLSHPETDKRDIANITPESILLTAQPNPLNGSSTIGFIIPQEGAVTMRIVDVLGRTVSKLSESKIFRAGEHELVWNASAVRSGAYLLIMQYGNTIKTMSLTVIK